MAISGISQSELDALGLAENTIVIFTADHGEMAGAANRLTHRLEVNCTLLAQAPGPLAHWTPVDVHIATARVRARVALDARKPMVQPGGSRTWPKGSPRRWKS